MAKEKICQSISSICKNCGKNFVITPEEQRYFRAMGFELSKRCIDCRKVEEVYVIGHSLSEVDYPYFKEICKKSDAKWYIGFHSLDDMKRLLVFLDSMGLSKVTVFKK